MAFTRSKSVRFQDDLETASFELPKRKNEFMSILKIGAMQIPQPCSENARNDEIDKSLQERELSRVFSEDYDGLQKKIFDPRGPVISRWNKIFLVACLISLFVDPLYFYLPGVKGHMCIDLCSSLEVALTVTRSMVDAFYMIQIYVRFHTGYVAPSSRVFGRGELVIDPSKIASRYLLKEFWLDLLAAVPLPQYLLRLYLIFPLYSQIIKTTGLLTETAWAGAAYNLMLFMLASHVLGSCWYLLSIERQEECWREVCSLQHPHCNYAFFDCRAMDESGRAAWFNSSNIQSLCDPNGKFFLFGIYADALKFRVTTSRFYTKYFYCFWWGLRNLSSLGQNLLTSTAVGEIIFTIIIVILGLVLFALLIGNMQGYLQSTTVRLEEWRIQRTDTEQWMSHRQLPHELKQSVRRYEQYKWIATRGVDEEAILEGLPVDLRRDIKRHLCLDLVRRVPLFDQMEERMLDAICERLKPALCTQGACVVREGDLVHEMLFIIRGHLDSYTTNGGRTGFFNSSCIGPGDFCGEELLPWALDPHPTGLLPSSTRTVEAISDVEAFALVAEDLRFVASQFRRLHSKRLRDTFRFYSHQWRTWAACFIQAAWVRFKRRTEAAELRARERPATDLAKPAAAERMDASFRSLGQSSLRMYAASGPGGSDYHMRGSLQKPVEPDFTAEEE
ncbi:protein CNGC15b-like isoform X2 [Malania oleifera]|uniref:protein CNGC15b-like isoform X2 n=1 Tax=Malania oleifera TaxID=397392 RepID=UPI0025AE9962|nr:protein CNGC15b-like isoform X2 [Malania oleifera]